MRIHISDPGGASWAEFSAAGDLIAFACRGAHWKLADPTPACGLLVAESAQEKHLFLPAAGSGAVFRSSERSLEVRFSELEDSAGRRLAVSLRLHWRLEAQRLAGRIVLEAAPESAVVDALIFPRLEVTVAENAELILPRLEGMIVNDAGIRMRRAGAAAAYGYAYPGQLSMQFIGWGASDRGLYLDCRDPAGWSKFLRVQGLPGGRACIQWGHYLPREKRPGNGFALPYSCSISGFDGSWFDACRIYRNWAQTLEFAGRGPEKRRKHWIGEIACWVWNRGRIDEVCPPVLELARRIGQPLALDWYWWHKHGYDTEYPDYFPPREGREAFVSAVQRLRTAGVRTQVYTNGIGYDMDGATWLPDGPKCTIRLETGEIKAVIFNKFAKHRLAFGCGGSELWLRKVRDFARRALGLGLDGVYIDMVSNVAGAYPCFHPEHGHAPGGGNYQVAGFRKLWRELRRAFPEAAFTTEAPSEVFMDEVDAFITINTSNERLGGVYDPAPLWNAVYHGRAVCFGNYALPDGIPPFDELWPQEYRWAPDQERDWRAECPDQFAIELARTLAGGIQPMVANLKAEHLGADDYAEDMDFLVKIARFYHAHREYLLWGEMLPPGALECEVRPVRFLQRMIFTAPGREKILTKPEPAVLHSAWRAPAGAALAVLVNYTLDPQPVVYRRPAGPAPRPVNGFQSIEAGKGIRGRIPPRTCLAIPLE